MRPLQNPDTRLSLIARLQQCQTTDPAYPMYTPDHFRFYREYRDLILLWCRHCGLTPTDAEEVHWLVVQKVLRKIGTYNIARRNPAGKYCFRAFLRTLTRRTVTDWRRKRTVALTGVDIDTAISPVAADAEEVTAEFALLRQAVETIRVRLSNGRFKRLTWIAFEQTQLLGRRTSEVAHELGCSPGVINGAVFKVRHMIIAEYRRLRSENN